MLQTLTTAGASWYWPFVFLPLLLLGCASQPERWNLAEVTEAGTVVLDDVPFHPQDAYHCGPASLLSILQANGVETDMSTLVNQVYLPGRRGSLQPEMRAAIRQHGRLAYQLPGEPAAVIQAVEAGWPVLILQNLGLRARPVWHYAVVIGFDADRNALLLHSGEQARQWESVPRWTRRWHYADRWAVIALQADQVPPSEGLSAWLQAASDFADRARPEEAITAWQTLLRHRPGEPVAMLGLANAHYQAGAHASSADVLETMLAQYPGHPAAAHNLAWLMLQDQRPCQARDVLISSREQRPSPAFETRIHRLLGKAQTACREVAP